MQQKVHALWHWSLTEMRDHPKEPIDAAADFTLESNLPFCLPADPILVQFCTARLGIDQSSLEYFFMLAWSRLRWNRDGSVMMDRRYRRLDWVA
jgi:hypothetical protein